MSDPAAAPRLAAVEYPLDALTLPGDALGGLLITAWEGPRKVTALHGHLRLGAADYEVDCNRREVRRSIVDVLMLGGQCEVCDGQGRTVGRGESYETHGTTAGMPMRCAACQGTGRTRPAHDVLWTTHKELRSEITVEQAAGILWSSVRRVDKGLRPVVNVLHPWGGFMGVAGVQHRPLGSVDCIQGAHVDRRGWWVTSPARGVKTPEGPETGEEGQARAEKAAVDLGYALLEHDGSIVVPDVCGPVRLEVTR